MSKVFKKGNIARSKKKKLATILKKLTSLKSMAYFKKQLVTNFDKN